MAKRYVSLWFRYLKTDWLTLRHPELANKALVLSMPSHGKMVITDTNFLAEQQGINKEMAVADARAIYPAIEVKDDIPDVAEKLLSRLAEWCIRFSPFVCINPPDGLILDVSGCPHLWGGDEPYLEEILKRIKSSGYDLRAAMADTIGLSIAWAKFGKGNIIIKPGNNLEAILPLPTASLRVDPEIIVRLHKLGLWQIKDFIRMPRPSLRRRFGKDLLLKLDQTLGLVEEIIHPVQPLEPYQERLPCLELILTATGIEIALKRLLETLCDRLQKEGKGIRKANFKCYRIDGKLEQINIETTRASYNQIHLFKLFELNLSTIEPAEGIELFVLDAPVVEDVSSTQEKIWAGCTGLENVGLAELLDRLAGKIGSKNIYRYLPDEHYWPERSMKKAFSLVEEPSTQWKLDRPRPIQLLSNPEPVEVTAPIPDYPPMLFRHKGKLHKIIRADGPERIEQEWWLADGDHRDYYSVEDEEGNRYWLFRSGHYSGKKSFQWFLHGYFA